MPWPTFRFVMTAIWNEVSVLASLSVFALRAAYSNRRPEYTLLIVPLLRLPEICWDLRAEHRACASNGESRMWRG